MNRLKAYMDQKLHSICRAQSKRMSGICHGDHFSVYRAYNISLGRDYRHAIPDDLLGKHRIWNLFQPYRFSRHRRENLTAFHKKSPSCSLAAFLITFAHALAFWVRFFLFFYNHASIICAICATVCINYIWFPARMQPHSFISHGFSDFHNFRTPVLCGMSRNFLFLFLCNFCMILHSTVDFFSAIP